MEHLLHRCPIGLGLDKIKANEYFYEDHVRSMIENCPMMVPFKEKMIYLRPKIKFYTGVEEHCRTHLPEITIFKRPQPGLGQNDTHLGSLSI